MKQMAYGTVALIGLFAIAGCYTDPTKDFNTDTYNTVQASPNFSVVKVGDSDQVLVRLVNTANAGAVTYAVSAVGAGIQVDTACTVAKLTSQQQATAKCYGYYRPVFNAGQDTLVPTTDKDAQQYFILGRAPGRWTFTLTPRSVNTGVSATVTAIVVPIDLGAALGTTTGLTAGTQVTITAPASVVFTSGSVPTFTKGPAPAVVGLSADSSQMNILVAPGDSGVVTVTKVGLAVAPTMATQTLVSTNAIALVPPITVAPTTVSTTTPAFGAQVTVTLGGGLKFLSNSTVSFGTTPTIILSRSADSSSATVVAFGGGATGGTVQYTNIALGFLTSVPLNVTGDKSVTQTAAVNDPNTNALATAPTITFPDSGKTLVISGGGGTYTNAGQCGGSTGDGCQLFKFVLTAPTSYSINFIWPSGQDLGLYRLNSTGTTNSSQGGCDNGGQDSPGESCTVNGLAAGTYYFAVVFFGTGSGYPPSADTVPPTSYQFSITRH